MLFFIITSPAYLKKEPAAHNLFLIKKLDLWTNPHLKIVFTKRPAARQEAQFC
jgi:hypothetical protein